MSFEHHQLDNKSLRKISGTTADWSALAADCVCFANASGGVLRLGIEDGSSEPPADQRIDDALVDKVRKRIRELTVNVQVAPQRLTADNGGEYIELHVARSMAVASTTDGRYFLRVGDTCRPLVGDDVIHLLNDRPAIPWETMLVSEHPPVRVNMAQQTALLAALRASDRVKDTVKEKLDAELLDHYGLTEQGRPTHLGILMFGSPADRARLGTAPIVQAAKYDERGLKINKWTWDDYALSPVELIDAVWSEVSDFREVYELPDGLFRQHIPAYDSRVIRELLVNAIVHRPYTQRGDIILNLHPDRLEVVNPGRLPLGVTPRTILHTMRRRNERMATLFHDLKRMEREGSGYDLMYELQLSQGRPVPVLQEGVDSVSVTVARRVHWPEVIRLMSQADARFQLGGRDRIALGLLAANDGMTARELAARLDVASAEDVQHGWLSRLIDLGLVQSSGRTMGTRYFVTPQWLKGSGLDAKTTLKRIEPHRLRALITEDLSMYPGSSSTDVHRRVASDLALPTVRRALEDLHAAGAVRHQGDRRWRRYWLTDKEQSA